MNIQPLGSSTAASTAVGGPDANAGAAASAASTAATAPKPAGTSANPPAKADPTRDQVDAAVKKLNDSMSNSSQALEFSVDHDSKEIVVKLVDQNTKEVLRQIPSPEALQMAKSIDESLDKKQGLLIRQTA